MPTIRSVTSAWRDAKVKHLARALDKACHVLADRVRANAPVESGGLKKSIHEIPARVESKLIKAEVVVNAPHGHLVEFGTEDQGPRPFFRPAVRSEEARMISIVRSET